MNGQEMNLTAAELKAVEEHKYYLSQQRGAEVSIEEAITDFLERFAKQWRQEKMRRDNLDQRMEIEKHKYLRSLEVGRDIGRATAAEDWCQNYAHIWRAERESLEQNGFKKITVIAHNIHGLHMRPASLVAHVAAQFDCDVYVHKDGMLYHNFLLDGRPYMNVKSILGFLSIGVTLGETLEFIATGAQAAEALAAVQAVMQAEASR